MNIDTQIQLAKSRLTDWIEKQGFEGWDPFDALNSPLLKKASLGNRRVAQLFVQVFKRSPINFRPLLGVKKGYNPKGMGLFLSSYLRKYLISQNVSHLKNVEWFAEWLIKNQSLGYSGACWGYNFDWPNRGFFAQAGTPTIVNTAFIGFAFLDIYRYLKDFVSQELWIRSLEIARSSCIFLQKDLNRFKGSSDEICFSYTPLDHRFVHNANLLGAQLLAEIASLTGEKKLTELAIIATQYTIGHQQKDGSWKYGEETYDSWIDNFHTGFVLVSLKKISDCLDIIWLQESIERGYQYWKDNLMLPTGIAKYYQHKVYPIDVHSIAQAIITYITFSDLDSEAMNSANQVALWGIENLQSNAGYYIYQIHPHYRIRIPYMRWGQAWMQRALTEIEFTNHNENMA